MDQDRCQSLIVLVILILAGIAAEPAAARSVTAVLGDTITLRGTASGMDEVYLFVTGPNLPQVGGKLENPASAVVNGNTGSFTRASVSGDSWEYRWVTRTAGKMLDAGTYTVYASFWPVDRSSLKSGDYQAITVTLTQPGLSGVTTGESGILVVISDPPGAEIIVDGVSQGRTPLEMTGVIPGIHEVRISLRDYLTQDLRADVESGNRTTLNVILQPVNPVTTLLQQTTVPATAQGQAVVSPVPSPSSTTATTASPTPARQPFPVMVTVWAILLGAALLTSARGQGPQ